MSAKKLEALRAKTDAQLLITAAMLPGIILLACWIGWISAQFFGADLVGLIKRRKEPISPQFYLIFAAVASVICSIWAWFNFRKQRQLVRHGILATAVLSKIGVGASGMRSCSYQFEYNGRKFTNHVSLLEQTAAEIGVGGELPILIDPSRPSRSLPLSEL